MAVNQQPPVFVLPDQSKNKIVDYALKGALLVLAIWGGRKLWKQWKVNQQEKQAADDPATQQAIKLRTAIEGAGTNEKAIFQTATEITDWEAVTTAYRNLYQANLTEDLKNDLNAEEYQKFFNIINLTKKKPDQKLKTGLDYTKGRIVVSKAQVNVRKTPRATGTPGKDKLLIFGKSNIITSVGKGVAVGVTTGRTSFDEKAEPGGVLFIEIVVPKRKASEKETFPAWVAASQVETITPQEYKAKPIPVLSITFLEYDKASSSLNGSLTGIDYRKEICCLQPTFILDDKFKVVGKAAKGWILGYPIMELKTPQATYQQFLTIDGTQRWVNKNHIKTIEQ